MQKTILDLESHLRQIKAGETLFAFAGLDFYPDRGDPARCVRAMLKVTRLVFKDGSGKLCFHFFLDLENTPGVRDTLGRLFQDLSTHALDLQLGQDFEYLSPVEALELDDSIWFTLRLTFSFKNMQDRAAYFVRERIVPSLEQRLPIRFQDLQLWEGEGAADSKDLAAAALRSFTSR